MRFVSQRFILFHTLVSNLMPQDASTGSRLQRTVSMAWMTPFVATMSTSTTLESIDAVAIFKTGPLKT